jgi:adenine deaminase
VTVRSFVSDSEELSALLAVSRGDAPADLVLRNARLVNVFTGEIYPADVAIFGGRIAAVEAGGASSFRGRQEIDLGGEYLAPGFIDAHVHIESSLMLPAEYANAVLPRGTTTVVTDPHEIANVHGLEGIRFMIDASEGLALRVYVMLSSCVPATNMETSGARLGPDDLASLIAHPRVLGIAEMMNYPGVAGGDEDMLRTATLGHAVGARVDGHAPLVGGRTLQAYVAAGVTSDHESVSAPEALEKLRNGVQLLIREGSTARNLDALLPVVNEQTTRFCSWATDDKQPDDLQRDGHIDHIIRRAVAAGLDPVTAIQMASINTARHYGLNDTGAVAPGYRADMVTFDDLDELRVTRTFAGGHLVAENGRMLRHEVNKVTPPRNNMLGDHFLNERSFRIEAQGTPQVRVIGVLPDQIVTRSLEETMHAADGEINADTARDILKIAVVERHSGTGHIGLGLVNGVGLREGAIASSIAHDSHNVVVVGATDTDMLAAARALFEMDGGVVAVRGGQVLASLRLPVAGLMSDRPVAEVREGMRGLLEAAASLGCRLSNPFMQMAFLALPVIPELKLTDLGLVDVGKFDFVSLFPEQDAARDKAAP